MDVLVMENVLYAANTTRVYDLKGSERSRWSPEDPTQAGAVLMDDNLRENNLTQPILVRVPLFFVHLHPACTLIRSSHPSAGAMFDQFFVYMCFSASVVHMHELQLQRSNTSTAQMAFATAYIAAFHMLVSCFEPQEAAYKWCTASSGK